MGFLPCKTFSLTVPVPSSIENIDILGECNSCNSDEKLLVKTIAAVKGSCINIL